MFNFTLGKWDISIGRAYHSWSHCKVHRYSNGFHFVFGKLSISVDDWTDECYTVCRECGSTEVQNRGYGDESWSVCSSCQTVEGGYNYVNKRQYQKALEN